MSDLTLIQRSGNFKSFPNVLSDSKKRTPQYKARFYSILSKNGLYTERSSFLYFIDNQGITPILQRLFRHKFHLVHFPNLG
jgi:hypothetical protein